MGYQRFNTSKTKPLDIIIFIANILAVITGIIYLLYGSDSIYWNIYGVYMLMVLFCNASMLSLIANMI